MTTIAYNRPLPTMQGLTKEFYDWCQKGELRFQRCTDCGHWRHVPWPMCRYCNSFNWEWARSSGKGKVHSWTTVHQAFIRGFADELPYAVAIIKLEEGVGLAAQVTNIPPDDLRIDMPVEVWFD